MTFNRFVTQSTPPPSPPPRKSSPYQYPLTLFWPTVSGFCSDFVPWLTNCKDNLESPFLSLVSVDAGVTALALAALKFQT